MRRIFVRVAAYFLLLLCAGCVLLLTGEVVLQFAGSKYAESVNYQPCLVWDSADVRPCYKPHCMSFVTRPDGDLVTYRFNSDGLRAPEPEFFTEPTIAVFGDSIVKGMFLQVEETIPSLLWRKIGASLKMQFLNAAVRLSSPTGESALYEQIKDHYRIRGMIVFVNGTDPNEERLLRGEATRSDSDGVPIKFKDQEPPLIHFFHSLNIITEGHSALIRNAARALRFRQFIKEIESEPINRETICGGVFRFAKQAQRDHLPLAFVATPHLSEGIQAVWNLPYQPENLRMMVNCARETGALVIDLSNQPVDPKDYYDGLHFRAPAVERLVQQLAQPLKDYFSNAAARSGNGPERLTYGE